MRAKIVEIFQSVQGEGRYAGSRQVFVRFYRCNMQCAWCDTPASIGGGRGSFEEYSLHEVMARIQQEGEGCRFVSFTGGEPLLQKDFLVPLCAQLKSQGYRTYLDTNGIFYEELAEVIKDIDVIAMDIKLPSSTKCPAFWKEHEEFLKIAVQKEVFIKVVISVDTLAEEVRQAAAMVSGRDRNLLFILQPNYFELNSGSIERCLEFQKDCSAVLQNVYVMPQIHKMMQLR